MNLAAERGDVKRIFMARRLWETIELGPLIRPRVPAKPKPQSAGQRLVFVYNFSPQSAAMAPHQGGTMATKDKKTAKRAKKLTKSKKLEPTKPLITFKSVN